MKRVGKALIIAGIMFLAGIILSVIGAGAVFQKVKAKNQTPVSDSRTWTEQTYRAEGADIKELIVDITSDNIRVEPAEGTEIELVWQDDSANPNYVVSQDGKSLQFWNKSVSGHGIFVLDLEEILRPASLEDEMEYQDIVIRIPASYMGSYQLDSTSGDIIMADVPAERSINVDSTSGDIDIERIDCQGAIYGNSTSGRLTILDSGAEDGITLESTSGNVMLTNVVSQDDLVINTTSGITELYNVQVTDNLELSSTSGDLTVEGVIVSDTLEFDSTSGDMTGQDLSIGELYTDTTSGNISLLQLTLGTGIQGSSTSGDFTISLTDTMEDYGIHTNTLSGYVTLPNAYHMERSRYINISTTSGDIKFEFAE